MYYGRLEAFVYKDILSQQTCSFTKKVNVNGMVFKLGLWLPAVPDSGNHKVSRIMEVCDIVLLDDKDISKLFVVCKAYTTASLNNSNICYIVDMTSVQNQFSIININEFLLNHHYPVKVHNVNDKFVFRCKRF